MEKDRLLQFKEKFQALLEEEHIKSIQASEDYYFQKAIDKHNEYINLLVDESTINILINKTKEKPFSYKKLLNSYHEGTIEHKTLKVVGELISYLDKNAAMKNELNQYQDKRTMALAFVRQNVWVQYLLSYKLEGNLKKLPEIIQNALKYLQNPMEEMTIFKEAHKQSILDTFFDGKQPTLFERMREIGIKAKNPMNDGCLYPKIFYNTDLREIWSATSTKEEPENKIVVTPKQQLIENNPIGETQDWETYTKQDFLQEVFITEEKYDTLTTLLKRKKNIILQGAPGVGKTYAAKRLAYSIIGEKNDERVKLVQFHQSYSYEDFIMGYRPDDTGFSIKYGSFYKFCKDAVDNPDYEYFFIIDEINRGNLSKIFGELLMLIEADKRGEKITLTYEDEEFSVPENIYIIGMMNTADRSLAIIDYALRRRFCFVELEPAFSSSSFKEHLMKNGLPQVLADKIINRLTALNRQIEEEVSLGSGFRIGHSYFCDCSGADEKWYRDIVKYEVAPLLEEYWFDNLDIAKEHIEELLRG